MVEATVAVRGRSNAMGDDLMYHLLVDELDTGRVAPGPVAADGAKAGRCATIRGTEWPIGEMRLASSVLSQNLG